MKRYPFCDLAATNAPYMEGIERVTSAVIRSGRYIGGETVDIFEQMLCRQTLPAGHCVGVSNGLDALRLAMRAVVIDRDLKGGEVIVAANTYIASILAIMDAGLTPVLADPDPVTMNLDTSRLDECLTTDTVAVMPVHLYGRVCWDELLREFAGRNGLFVLEDNAQAIGARAELEGLNGTNVTGGLGHAGAFSFYPTKNIGALGDAGAVVCADTGLATTVRALANYGSSQRYVNDFAGYNCRLDSIQAAILAEKLPDTDAVNAARRAKAGIYDALIDNPKVTKPLFTPSMSNVWHQYVVRVEHRKEFLKYLEANGVGYDIHYPTPPHLQKALKGVKHGPLPIAEMLAEQVVSLPVSAVTTGQDVREIAAIINAW